MEAQILTWITFIPLIGMVAILLLPRSSIGAVKGVSLVATAIPLVLATWLYFGLFQKGTADLQLVQDVTWIAAIDAHYKVGVDGLSLALVWLTTLLLFIGVPASFSVPRAGKAYYALLLLLEVGILGVFVALDFFLFYVCWEIMLLPMYFLIGIWGGPRREYAAIKFFLYTLAGSVFMLLCMIALYYGSDPAPIAERFPEYVTQNAEGVLGFKRADGSWSSHTFNITYLQALAGVGHWAAQAPILGLAFTKILWVALFIGFAIKVPMFPF